MPFLSGKRHNDCYPHGKNHTRQQAGNRVTIMSRLFQLFRAHPASVGENYFEHMAASFSFGSSMLLASLAALIHGIFPFLFVKTGSTAISRLYDRMVANRVRAASRHP